MTSLPNVSTPLLFSLAALLLIVGCKSGRPAVPMGADGGGPGNSVQVPAAVDKPKATSANPVNPQAKLETKLEIRDVSFAGPAGHRKTAEFSRGEALLCLFTVSGYQQKEGNVELFGNLEASDAKGRLVFQKRGLALAQGKAPTEKAGRLRAMAKIDLHRATPPGRYTLKLVVEDRLANTSTPAQGSFRLLGTAFRPAERLALRSLRAAASDHLPAGSYFPLRFEVAGFATAPSSAPEAPQKSVSSQLSLSAELTDKTGASVKKEHRPLRSGPLPHAQLDLPFETQFALPAALAPGKYLLSLRVDDALANTFARGTVAVTVVAKRFGLFNVHLHDAGRLPRDTFRLGEKAALRFSVQGFATKNGMADLSVDLAVAGPSGGVYLLRKKAASLSGAASAPFAKAGRFPMEVPLTLPALAPTGKYRIVLRAKDRFGSAKEIVAEHAFQITGDAPRPLAQFAIDQLQVRRRADLPEIKGDTFVAGRSYSLTVHAGAATKEVGKLTYEADLSGKIQLRRFGKIAHTQEKLFELKRRFNYRPLRIRLNGQWNIPSMLRPGLYDMELVLENQLEKRVSQLIRRIEIVQVRQ